MVALFSDVHGPWLWTGEDKSMVGIPCKHALGHEDRVLGNIKIAIVALMWVSKHRENDDISCDLSCWRFGVKKSQVAYFTGRKGRRKCSFEGTGQSP